MADLKLSDLAAATGISDDTFFYAIQGNISRKLSSNVLAQNLVDPILKNRIILDGVQLISGTDTNQTISLTQSRTEFNVGPFAVQPTLPNGNRDGLIKIITLANVQGGSLYLSTDRSNIYPNTWVSMERNGDSIMLMYSSNTYSNGWVILGISPGVKTSVLLDEANISDSRIRRAISAKDSTINYDEANGTIQVGNISNLLAKISLANVTTDDLREGNVNLYFTNGRAIIALTPDLNQIRKKNANVIYVSTNGDDRLDGFTMANAVANIHVALSRIGEKWTVKVFPGRYILHNNPVTIPKRSSLIGNDLRTCDIYPENETADMFYMNLGAYVNGFTFRGHRAANPDDPRTGAAVFSYNPDGSAGNITTSPYIQNCSSITTTGTGVRVDGNHVGGLKSMVLDAFTQFNEGGIGIYLLNQGYMQLVSLFTICCEYSVLAEKGGFASITNSNTSFGKYGLAADGVSPTLYKGKVIRQLSSRSVEMELPKIPNLNDRILMASYNQEKCFRDTGLIVDSLALDLAYQSNTQSRFSGLQYWGQNINRTLDQTVEVNSALQYLRTLAANVVINNTDWDNSILTPYQPANAQVIVGGAPGDSNVQLAVSNLLVSYIDIYNNGLFGFTDKIVPNKYQYSQPGTWTNAANLLIANKNFIASEVSAFFGTQYPYATYIPGKSIYEDAADIVDSLAFDILGSTVGLETNRQTLTKAALNYDYSTISAVQNQQVQTGAAFTFIKTFIDEVLLNQPIANTYQTAYVQDTSVVFPFVTGTVTQSEIDYVRNRIDDIVNIILNGPTYENVQYNIKPISVTANTSPNIIAATKIMIANRDFIRAEVLEYVNQNWADISNGTRNFYTVGESSNVSPNVYVVTFDEKIFAVDRPLANSIVSFHQGSYIQTSTHTFEYVGSGTSLTTALPYNGGKPIQEYEVLESRGGAVYYTSTDHKGDFRIGNELLINRATGTINGRTFNKSLFAVMTPFILALQ
jgi:hypothetical protein